jgi:hypothetical protein
MKKWTWQWFILLAILGMLLSCGAWIDRQPYDIYEDVYKPDRPWKQMIWKARVEIADFGLRIADFKKKKRTDGRGRPFQRGIIECIKRGRI